MADDIFAKEEIERDIALNAGYLLCQGVIDIADSRFFNNEAIPEMAKEFVKKYPRFAKPGQHEDYMEKIDSFCDKYLKRHYRSKQSL